MPPWVFDSTDRRSRATGLLPDFLAPPNGRRGPRITLAFTSEREGAAVTAVDPRGRCLFVDPSTLAEKAPVQIDNASRSLTDLGDRVSRTLQPLGLRIGPTQRVQPSEQSVIYDYSGGRYPRTVQWLADYFGASVRKVSAGTTPPTPNPPAGGVVVVLGHDYALRWIGQ